MTAGSSGCKRRGPVDCCRERASRAICHTNSPDLLVQVWNPAYEVEEFLWNGPIDYVPIGVANGLFEPMGVGLPAPGCWRGDNPGSVLLIVGTYSWSCFPLGRKSGRKQSRQLGLSLPAESNGRLSREFQ
jgi:hypothetical protein